MNIETLYSISGQVCEARSKLTEIEVTEWNEDIISNWIYQLENVEMEIDVVIDQLEQDKKQ